MRARLPILLLLALGLLVFGKGMWEGTTRFLGREYVDAWGTQWFYWFVERQMALGEGFGTTNLFFFPWGKDIYLHTGGNVLDGFIAWPIRWLIGPVAGYNLFILGILATNYLTMRRLLLQVLGGRVPRTEAASLAAVFFTFNPWALHELRDGRPTQALLAFTLLFFSDYLRMDQDRRGWLPVRAGMWLAIAGLTYWYNALFAGIAAGLIAVFRTLTTRRLDVLVRHALAGLVALVIVAPFALPMLGSDAVPGLLDVDKWSLGSWTPTTKEGVQIGLYTFEPTSLGSGFYAMKNDGGMAYLREDTNVFVAQVLLAGLGLLVATGRARVAALVLIAVSLAISIGPETVGIPNPIYFALAKATSIFQRLWWPSRALVLGHIGMALLTAFALYRLKGLAPWVATACAAWFGWELSKSELGPMATWEAGIPQGYRCLAEAEEGAILELPYAHTQAHLYFQTQHGRPMFGGMVEDNTVFAPPEQVAYRSSNSFVAVLLDQGSDGLKAPVFSPQDRAALKELGYRWVVLDKRAYIDVGDLDAKVGTSLEGRARWVRRTMTSLMGKPVFEDEATAIYAPWDHGSPCPDGVGE
jgi:hypothetical protein